MNREASEAEKAGVFFHQFADRFDTFYEGKRSRWMQLIDRTFRRDMYIRFQRTFDQFGKLEGKTVLDIGCGSGIYVMEALTRGASHVVAVDPAPRMLELLRDRLQRAGLQERCTLIEGTFPQVSAEPSNHVIVMGVMDYVEDAGSFLGSLRPLVLGSAAVSFPSKHWFRTPVRKLRYKLRNCPVYFYDQPQIEQLGRQAGFGSACVHKIRGAGMDYHVSLKP